MSLKRLLELAGVETNEDIHKMAMDHDDELARQSDESGESDESDINPEDVLKMDVPLFIRLLEWSKEDAKTDMQLHKMTENVIKLSTHGRRLTMDDYERCIANTNTGGGEESYK